MGFRVQGLRVQGSGLGFGSIQKLQVLNIPWACDAAFGCDTPQGCKGDAWQDSSRPCKMAAVPRHGLTLVQECPLPRVTTTTTCGNPDSQLQTHRKLARSVGRKLHHPSREHEGFGC